MATATSKVVFAVSLLVLSGPASSAEMWKLLATSTIEPGAIDTMIEAPETAEPVRSVRLVARSGNVLLKTVLVGYADGRRHAEDRRINLLAGERTRPIDPRDRTSKVATIHLLLASGTSQAERVVIDVWGLVPIAQANAKSVEETDALITQVEQLYRAGKYADAMPIALQALAIREKALRSDHPKVAEALNDLGAVYLEQGRYADAEPLLRRSLVILETTHSVQDPSQLHQYARHNLARLLQAQGRDTEAELLLKRDLATSERAPGPDCAFIRAALSTLSAHYLTRGRLAEAEPLLKRYLDFSEIARRPDEDSVATTLNNLAFVYETLGRYADAEPIHKRSLTLREKLLGPDHLDVATSLNNLAALYAAQDRHAEAEALFKRSLQIRETVLGRSHRTVADSLNNLSTVYGNRRRYSEAEHLMKRSLAIYETALGANHPLVGTLLNNLGILYNDQDRYVEAEPLFRRSLSIQEMALGPDHINVAYSLDSLAGHYKRLGLYAEAEPLYMRSLAIFQRMRPDHPVVGVSLSNLATLAIARRDWKVASNNLRRSTAVIQRRTERGLAGAEGGSAKGEAARSSEQFVMLVQTTHRLATGGGVVQETAASEMFEAAQWPQASEAAASLAQMAARSAKGSPELFVIVRDRQDLVAQWHAADKLLIAAKSEPPFNRNAALERVQSERLVAIDKRLAEIDARFAKDFPDYAALASAKPVSIANVQEALRDDEALVLFLDAPEFMQIPEETFIWVVTKTDMRWVRSELGTKSLTDKVAALRCGLDEEEWVAQTKARRCATLLGLPEEQIDKSRPLPFHLGIAHELYRALFGQFEDLIKDKKRLLLAGR